MYGVRTRFEVVGAPEPGSNVPAKSGLVLCYIVPIVNLEIKQIIPSLWFFFF